eukprot:363069_1
MLCDTVSLVERIINAFVYCMGSILVIGLSYKYFKQRVYETGSSCLHSMVIILFLLILMAYIIFAVSVIFTCVDVDIWRALKLTGSIIYLLQYSVLMWLLFYRLCLVFTQSQFAVSASTKRAFYCVYCIFNCMSALSLYSVSSNLYLTVWGPIISTTTYAILILVVLYLLVLFVRKLLILSAHHGDEHNKELIAVATKTFILTLWCVASSILMAFCLGIKRLAGRKLHYEFALALSAAFDLGTNFVTILFGFTVFESWYMKICGYCQREGVARKCFEKRANLTEQNKLQSISITPVTPPPDTV